MNRFINPHVDDPAGPTYMSLSEFHSLVENTPDTAYPPLPSKTSIRYLKLQPALSGNLNCTVVTGDLADKNFNYQALSYTWGEPKALSHRVLCNGVMVDVTKNLHSALSRLRYRETVRHLWVDALCIDQGTSEASLAEKSTQVQMMKQIYSMADKVIVDLGESDESEIVMSKMFSWLALIPVDEWDVGMKSAGVVPHFEQVKTQIARSVYDPRWRSLEHFVTRPWFARLWCLQEFVVAKEIEVLLGTHSLGSDTTFVDGLSRAISRLRDLAEDLNPAQVPAFTWASFDRAFKQVRELKSIRELYQNGSTCQASYILGIALDREVEEARDRLFAVFELIDQSLQESIDVSYQMQISEVCCQLGAALIANGNSNFLLSHATGISETVPTWCIDLERPKSTTALNNLLDWESRLQEYNACGNTEFSLDISSDIRILDATAAYIGVVDNVSTPCPATPIDIRLDIHTSESEHKTSMQAILWEHTSHVWFTAQFSGANQDAYWMTLLALPEQSAGRTILRRNDHQEWRKFSSACLNRRNSISSTMSYITPRILEFQKAWSYLAPGRRFCKLDGGQLALVPANTRAGDIIVIILGCPVPFVVRDTRKKFRLVGPCYVYGVMNGQAVDSKDCKLFRYSFH